MKDKIKRELKASRELKKIVADKMSSQIAQTAKWLIASYKRGGKLIVCGNGGSAADAQHLAAEMLGKFKKERKALPAIALTTNSSIITAIANDYGYEKTFLRQTEAWLTKKDVFIAISTSGNSQNVNLACQYAKKIGAKTIGLLGKNGGETKNLVDLSLVVPSDDTARIQEAHITIIHILCGLVEEALCV